MIIFFRQIKKSLFKIFSGKVHEANKEWFQHELSDKELLHFIIAVREGKSGKALIGKISNKTVKTIKNLVGAGITKIILESSAVTHAEKNMNHHLRKDDIQKCIEVINNPRYVTKSPRENRCCPVLIFEGDINGSLIFVERVHIKHGELSLVTAYRKSEAGQGPTG